MVVTGSDRASRQGTSFGSFDLREPVPKKGLGHLPPPEQDRQPTALFGESPHAENTESQGSGKRPRVATADFAQRKRAAVACQFCRVRKTKCDNVRPRCGYCVRQKAKCVYGQHEVEESETQPSQTLVSNEQLMRQLEEIKSMLSRTQLTNQVTSIPTTSTPSFSLAGQSPTPVAPDRDPTRLWSAGLRCESLLRWPCLAAVVPPSEASVDCFPLSPGYEEVRKMDGTNEHGGKTIREDALVPLCRKFLIEVHPRNPILDDRELMRHARHAAGNGLVWDAASCLVLLACALACYTTPWIKPSDDFNHEEGQESADGEDQEGAEACYVAAQKRFGLLGNSIQDIQGFLLATIFEKFSFRPLRAWFHVQQACDRLVARLLQRGERPLMPFRGPNPDDYHLEQRLFWSCVRAESELASELGMNPSRLRDFSYPDAFPSPPDDLFAQPSPDVGLSSSSFDDEQRKVNERGWCYYLSEISIRRTVDESFNVLYGHGEAYWMENPAYLIRQYRETERQIASWHYHLPDLVKYADDSVVPDEEFAASLQGRAMVWREYALRPIMYYVLHCPANQHIPAEADELAAREVQLCAMLVQRLARVNRHGGTWFICRKAFTAACVILSAALHPDRVQPPQEWPGLTLLVIQVLNRWGRDAQDVRRMAEVLQFMYEEVYRRRG